MTLKKTLIKAVGIKRLKTHLSEYVRMVKNGDTILVTEYDEVVAELGPPRLARPAASSLEGVLATLSDSGEITRARVKKENWTWKAKGIGLPAGTAQGLLDNIRSDR